MGQLDLLDVPPQVTPAPLLGTKQVIVGGVAVAHHGPGEVYPDHRIDHVLAAMGVVVEVADRWRAEGPDIARYPILSPAGFIPMDHRTPSNRLLQPLVVGCGSPSDQLRQSHNAAMTQMNSILPLQARLD